MDKPSEEDKKWWFWKGEMFADGDWRDRAIAINTKMNIVHEHMESFRRTLDAVLSGYDGLDELRYHHATAFRRSEEHTSELQSLMRISYAVFCLKKKTQKNKNTHT